MSALKTVFQGVHFYLVEAKLRNPAEIKQLLRDGGGTREFYVAPLVTHVITDDPLGDGILAPVKDAPVPVVHSDWVRMSSKCGAQLPVSLYEVNVAKLFSGLVFCLSKPTRSDREKLCIMLMCYGGRIQRHLDHHVTHLVTMVTTGPKYETALKHANCVAMVTPNWVLDCIESGKLQDVKGYHPACVQQNQEEQRSWNGGHDTITFQLAQYPMSLPTFSNGPIATPTNGPIATPTSGDDCCNTAGVGGVSNEPAAAAGVLPSTSGPVASEEKEEVPMEIGDTHKTEPQETGNSQDPKVPVQAPVMADNHVTPPVMADNHVTPPVMADNHVTPPVMADNHVTPPVMADNHVTPPVMADNHVTPPVMADNHVTPPVMADNLVTPPVMAGNHVTPPVSSEATLVEQPLPQFLRGLVFVVKGYQEHLDEGTVQKWKEVIIQHGGDIVEKYDTLKVTHLLALHKNCPDFDMAFRDGKCIASAHWLNDVLLEQKVFPPCNALHLPTYFKLQVPGTDQLSITLTNYSGAERDLVKDMIRATGIPYTGHLSKTTTHLVCKMPFGRKYERACDLGIKVINAAFLSEVIHNGQIPAILYPRHTKLGSPDEFCAPFYEAVRLLKPWQSFIAEYASNSPQWVNHESTRRAFSIFEQATGEGQDVGAQLIRSGESSCAEGRVIGHTSSIHPLMPCVVFTGINVQLLGHLKKVVLKLGGRVTESVNECTHLVATRIARTVKFLCGISVCRHIVMPQWLDQSNQMNRFVDEAPYVLRDQEAEVLFNMSVATSLERARQTPLLKGRQLFATASVSPPYESLRDIVRCAGGELLDEQEMRNRFGRTLEHIDQNLPLVVISCHEDVESGHCAEFFARNIAVYNPEFILTGVLRQQLECSQNQLFQSIQV
ncbi:hypothetical protein EMCRGX_G033205 [Ephydatia muelleri]